MDFGPSALPVLDAIRWLTMIWLLVGIGWLIQIMVISRNPATTYLVFGLCISLFIDIGSQFNRLGHPTVMLFLPLIITQMTLITLGMRCYVKMRCDIEFVKPFYFFLRFRREPSDDR